jgi:ATP-binding protein involved in chromosome partitioning
MSKALAALEKVIDPELRAPITKLGMVEILSESDTQASVRIKLTIAGCPAAQKIERDVRQALDTVFESFELEMTTMTQVERDELKKLLRGDRPVRYNPFVQEDNFTRVIFVGSGKGGVGKSTLTANLATALAASGRKVGLIDADIFGYSIPGQLGIEAKPTKVDQLMLPPIAFDVRVMSIGFFVEGNQPIGWRGPMLHRAIEQFLTDVYWGDLDFLLVDLPPGTGDVAISLGQLLPKAQSLVVTTPQSAAATVAQRSGAIGAQTGQAVLGVVENMAYLETEGIRNYIFGQGGGEAVASALTEITGQDVKMLSQIPIAAELREASDLGVPLVISNPEHAVAKQIFALAGKLAAMPLDLKGKSLGLKPR